MKPNALLLRDLAEAWGFREGIAKYAWADIRARFDRTVLGPFWVVVTTLMWVFSVGLTMTQLFKQDLATQMPFLAFGVFAWQFVSSTLGEASSTFGSQKTLMGAYPLPKTFFALRVVTRNLIVLSFLTLVAIPLSMYFKLFSLACIPHIFAVFAVYALIAIPVVLLIGILGARFLDTGPMILIMLNIMIIVTPVFWRKNLLPADHPLVALNPFVPILDLYRDIFLTGGAPMATYEQCLLFALVMWIVASVVFQLTGRKISNWL